MQLLPLNKMLKVNPESSMFPTNAPLLNTRKSEDKFKYQSRRQSLITMLSNMTQNISHRQFRRKLLVKYISHTLEYVAVERIQERVEY